MLYHEGMMKPHCEKSGILRFRTIPEPLVRLFCFPYAGAGASIFRAWSKEFPAYVDVCGVQPPGKEERFSEMPARNMAVLLEGLAKSIVSECEIPFVFFGYSMGALLAFELARLFRKTAFARVFSIEHSADSSIEGDDTRRYGDTALTFLYAPVPPPTASYRPLPS